MRAFSQSLLTTPPSLSRLLSPLPSPPSPSPSKLRPHPARRYITSQLTRLPPLQYSSSKPHHFTLPARSQRRLHTDTSPTTPPPLDKMAITSFLAPNHAGMPTPPETPLEGKVTKPLGFNMYPVASPAQDLARLKHHLNTLTTPLLKHMHLSRIRRSDPNLFFAALKDDLDAMAPLVYTPTVGEACQKYSQIYTGPEGLYLSIDDKGHIADVLKAYASTLTRTPQIIVVTDGSRILGLGDLGIGGMGISVGKLNLYVAGGGIDPNGCLPVVFDMGTNNQTLIDDPLYIGLKRPRASLAEAEELMDEFMAVASSIFPSTVIQHEDFYSEAAFLFLEKYQGKYRMFNDDIQGTGAVILAGFLAAARKSSAISGQPLKDHKVVFLGGGSAAVGVAKEMMNFFKQQGLSEQEAKERFWLIDTKGLITSTRADVVSDKIAAHKKYFIRNDTEGKEYKSLAEVVEYVRPTALVGLSTTFGAFEEPVVRRMADLNKAPIIFPLSNPTSKCELSFADALDWTDGRVLFASGSPYAPIVYNGKLREAAQGNNFLVFPGIGFGAMISGATTITDGMITAGAMWLSEAMTVSEEADELLYPRLGRIREVSARVAAGVVREAQRAGVDTAVKLRSLTDEQLIQTILENQWHATY